MGWTEPKTISDSERSSRIVEEDQDNALSAESSSRGRKAPSAFRTISEVSADLNVQQHVLRFWETKFSQVRPLKRGGGRRYYRPEDVAVLQKIHHLLYTEGYTIKGVQKLLKGMGKSQVSAADVVPVDSGDSLRSSPSVRNDHDGGPAFSAFSSNDPRLASLDTTQKELLRETLDDLRAMRARLDKISEK